MAEERTEIPHMIVENFEDMLKQMHDFSVAMSAFSKSFVKFTADLGKLAQAVTEIKTNQRLKRRV